MRLCRLVAACTVLKCRTGTQHISIVNDVASLFVTPGPAVGTGAGAAEASATTWQRRRRVSTGRTCWR